MRERRIIVIAGPNGAGKTTFAQEFLPKEAHCPTFINADLIAAGISPLAPESVAFEAGRLMLKAIDEQVARGERFAIETTLSDPGYADFIKAWQRREYRISIYYLSLQSPELAIARVAERVRQGGHKVSEFIIRHRFLNGLNYFKSLYQPLVDDWIHFDTSGEIPILLEWGERS